MNSYQFLRALCGDDPPGHLVLFVLPGERPIWIPATQLEEAGHFAKELARTYNTYAGVALQDKAAAFAKWRAEHPDKQGEPTTRGYSGTAVALPGLWADVDVLHSVHKATNLPPTSFQG